MELVSINNKEQFDNIQNVIRQSGHNQTSDIYWTSGTDLGNENNFFWTSSGQNIDYNAWNDGQPDNTNDNENCVELRYRKNVYKLNDNNCYAKVYFICTSVDIDVHCQCKVDNSVE